MNPHLQLCKIEKKETPHAQIDQTPSTTRIRFMSVSVVPTLFKRYLLFERMIRNEIIFGGFLSHPGYTDYFLAGVHVVCQH